MTFITYPAIVVKVLEMFDCSVYFEDKQFLFVSPTDQCFSPTYQGYFIWALIMVVVYVVGVPLAALILLIKFRKAVAENIIMVCRFLADGYKADRFYWEVVIVLRKCLIVACIILFRSNVRHQIYTITFIIQAALIIHVLYHPYNSTRQHRLELWSLFVLLITLFVSLFVLEQNYAVNSFESISLSAATLVIHIALILAFAFFIGRGLLRTWATNCWNQLVHKFKKMAPKKMLARKPQFPKIMMFFQMFASATEYDRNLLYTNLEKWWKFSPNYKRRRLMSVFEDLAVGTSYEGTISKEKVLQRNNSGFVSTDELITPK